MDGDVSLLSGLSESDRNLIHFYRDELDKKNFDNIPRSVIKKMYEIRVMAKRFGRPDTSRILTKYGRRLLKEIDDNVF